MRRYRSHKNFIFSAARHEKFIQFYLTHLPKRIIIKVKALRSKIFPRKIIEWKNNMTIYQLSKEKFNTY